VVGYLTTILWYVFLFVVLPILFIVMVRVQRGKVWRRRIRSLSEEDRSLPLKKQKAIWRSRYKEEQKHRRESRTERRKRLEEEEVEKGFSLFKKKPQAESRRRTKAKVIDRPSPSPTERRLSLEEIGELDLDS
jgi:hypothetical protein